MTVRCACQAAPGEPHRAGCTVPQRAKKFYESEACSKFFDQARERFPKYNTDEDIEATDWILGEMENEFDEHKDWSDDVRDELNDMILAGLT